MKQELKHTDTTHTKTWLSSPHMGGQEIDFIHDAFETNWIAPLGPNVVAFEDAIQTYLGSGSFVTALSSGTAAIHLALILAGVSQGDEVICQSKTFSASANPILYLGATPIFVDSEFKTWNLCPEQLEIAIKDRIEKGKKPKAIIAVHLYGMPYQVDAINRISKTYDIPVIEDSAEAFGSSYKNEKCGTFGALAILSFNGNKIITTSGGGALVSKDVLLNERALFLATQAREAAVEYHHKEVGYNYRLSNVLAGIGRGQMIVLDDRVKARRTNFEFYKSELDHISDIEFLNEPEGYLSNRWLTCILTPSEHVREDLRLALEASDIESRLLWKPMHQQPVFESYPQYLNGVSDMLFRRGLCLPSGSNLTLMQLHKVTQIIQSYFGQ